MSFMNNVNQLIGDNMRFVRQYQENPEQLSGTSSTSSSNSAQTQKMMLMMMLMLMQMLNPNAQNATGSSTTGTGSTTGTPDLLSALSSMLPLQAANLQSSTAQSSTAAGDRSLQQNPAYQFLSGQLPTDAPDFTDSANLEAHMDDLLTNSDDLALRTLGSKLRGVNPNGVDLDGLKSYVLDRMGQEGHNQTEQAKFELLFDGIQTNKLLALAQNQTSAASGTDGSTTGTVDGTTDAETAAQIEALQSQQSQYAQAWQALQPASANTAAADPANLTQSVQDALTANQFTPVQLGQSLKALMATAPDSSMDSLVGLLGNLMKSGTLNINSFLESGYLDNITPSRRGAVLDAVENAGLIQDSGQPNTRFAGFILDALSRPGDSSTKSMVQQFLQDKWQTVGQDPNSNEGQALLSLFVLAGIQPDASTV